MAVSLLGHAVLLAAGLAATLLLPVTPPSPPAFTIELAVAPGPIHPEADLAESVPLPQPPPEALVVPDTAELAAVLPAPEAPPAPVPVPNAAELAATLPVPDAPAELVPAPPATSVPTPMPAVPKPVMPHPVKPALTKRVLAKPTPAKPAPVQPNPIQSVAPSTAASAAAQPAAESAVDAASMLIANPRFRRPPRPPAYPRRAVELRDEGEALIGALLDPTGTPRDLRVLRSSGHPMLDRAALDAVGGWAFEPGRRAGQPVSARIEIPVRFTLR